MFRTIRCVWHPRTGITVFLPHLSTTTELVFVNLIPQHDPESDPEFASYGDPGLPQTLLDQFATVETLQLRIPGGGRPIDSRGTEGATMDDFPDFMKRPANKIATSSQVTPGVEGYVFDGADGSQMAFWTCRETAATVPHIHDYDEYMPDLWA